MIAGAQNDTLKVFEFLGSGNIRTCIPTSFLASYMDLPYVPSGFKAKHINRELFVSKITIKLAIYISVSHIQIEVVHLSNQQVITIASGDFCVCRLVIVSVKNLDWLQKTD